MSFEGKGHIGKMTKNKDGTLPILFIVNYIELSNDSRTVMELKARKCSTEFRKSSTDEKFNWKSYQLELERLKSQGEKFHVYHEYEIDNITREEEQLKIFFNQYKYVLDDIFKEYDAKRILKYIE